MEESSKNEGEATEIGGPGVLFIARATYGPADVTIRAREVCKEQGSTRLFISAGSYNDVFGDSDCGVPKELKVCYKHLPRNVSLVDAGEWEETNVERGSSTHVHIVQAMYGPADVTESLRNRVRELGGALNVPGDRNAFFQNDPAPGVQKRLHVFYKLVPEGLTCSAHGEWQAVNISSSGEGLLGIYEASYGPADVTAKVRELVEQQGGRSLSLDGDFNSVFGDPEPGVGKEFSIMYKDLPPPPPSLSRGEHESFELHAGEGQLVIVDAEYGPANVTQRARELVHEQGGGQLVIASGNFNDFFGDPLPGTPKRLVVSYKEVPVETHEIVHGEGEGCEISCEGDTVLIIASARYGPADVTKRVRELCQQQGGKSLRLSGDYNSHFGDPEPGVFKRFVVVSRVANAPHVSFSAPPPPPPTSAVSYIPTPPSPALAPPPVVGVVIAQPAVHQPPPLGTQVSFFNLAHKGYLEHEAKGHMSAHNGTANDKTIFTIFRISDEYVSIRAPGGDGWLVAESDEVYRCNGREADSKWQLASTRDGGVSMKAHNVPWYLGISMFGHTEALDNQSYDRVHFRVEAHSS